MIVLCGVPLAALGQQEMATMTGTIRDATGAVMPNAVVVATNIRTNISVKTETDDRGVYTIPSLRPGDYSVSAERPGFSKLRWTRAFSSGVSFGP